MIKAMLLDSRFFPREELRWQEEVRNEFHDSGIELHMAHVPQKGIVHETDLETFSGLAFAVAGLAIAIGRLLKKPVETWTYAKLHSEVTCFLKLKGVEK